MSGIVLSNSRKCTTDFGNQFIKPHGDCLLVVTVDDFAQVRHVTAGGRKSQSIKAKAQPISGTQFITNDKTERYVRFTVAPANVEVD